MGRTDGSAGAVDEGRLSGGDGPKGRTEEWDGDGRKSLSKAGGPAKGGNLWVTSTLLFSPFYPIAKNNVYVCAAPELLPFAPGHLPPCPVAGTQRLLSFFSRFPIVSLGPDQVRFSLHLYPRLHQLHRCRTQRILIY
jgi:hypothetical protein